MDSQTQPQAEESTLRVRKKIRIREEIVRVEMKLFTRRGFEATTMEEIARAAEVSRQTVLRYFPTKELLLFPQHDAYFEQFRIMGLTITTMREWYADDCRGSLVEMGREALDPAREGPADLGVAPSLKLPLDGRGPRWNARQR